MRTYERGVEGETLACGTGSVACAIITHELHGISSPISIHTRSNEILSIAFKKESNGYSGIQLTGSAKILYKGVLKFDKDQYIICS